MTSVFSKDGTFPYFQKIGTPWHSIVSRQNSDARQNNDARARGTGKNSNYVVCHKCLSQALYV